MNGIIARRSTAAKAQNWGLLKSTSALSPSASATDTGVPFAAGGVAGSANARSPPAADAAAPHANIHAVVSKFSMPNHLTPTKENTPDATQPTVPKTRILGNSSFGRCAMPIAAESDHVGM